MKALIFKNKVVQLRETEFPVAPEMQWQTAPAGCKVGWGYNGTDFINTDPTAEEIAAQAAAQAAKVADQTNISNDTFINSLKAMSLADVDTYIDGQFSNIADADDAAIDAAIAGMTTVEALKEGVKDLAKDNVRTKSILKIVSKIAIYSLKKEE